MTTNTNAASVAAESSEPLVRYCPGCGSVGPVEAKYRDCCPDGSEARMIPEKLANKCRDTFRLALDGLLDAPGAAPDASYSIDADPQGIRALVADTIMGALAFGAQGNNPPPEGHWLAPFWEMARCERASPGAVAADYAEKLHRFLNAAAGEGLLFDGVDAADLYVAVFPKTYERAVAHLDAGVGAVAAEPTGWQPIATAPKNRTVLAGYRNSHGHWRTVRACYYPADSLELHPDHDLDGDDNGFAPAGWYEETETHEVVLPLEVEPTNWQPLPPAPKEA